MNILTSKEKEAWLAEYEGHRIEVVNAFSKTALMIDGEEADSKGGISVSATLKGKLPSTDGEVIAIVNGAEKLSGICCHIIIGKTLEARYGVVDKDGVFTALED